MSTYTPIATQTLSSAAASVTFSGIPQTYTDLVLVCNARSARTADNFNTITVQVNGLTTSIYSYTTLSGDGSAVQSTRESNQTSISPVRLSTSASSFTSLDASIIHFMNYSNTTTNKTVLGRGSSMGEFYEVITTANLIRTTNAITSITLSTALAGDFVSGSSFTLYGIGAGSPKAFGGDTVLNDGTYWYHVYRSSGVFAPVTNLSCDYLVIAGGGGGGRGDTAGNNSGGAGGAGGLRSTVTATGGGGTIESALALTGGSNYTVTVGAGGAAATGVTVRGTNGNNSVFATVTSTGGGGGGSNNFSPWTGATGGSGGGGSSQFTGPYTNGVGGTGTANQGYAGGQGNINAGGGGGGAGAVGSAGNAGTTVGGAGGAGVAVSITGSSVTYAGGGGGNGASGGGAGGSGGGGAGSYNGTAGSGTANTGGGGGASSNTSGAGGSGTVIVRYLV